MQATSLRNNLHYYDYGLTNADCTTTARLIHHAQQPHEPDLISVEATHQHFHLQRSAQHQTHLINELPNQHQQHHGARNAFNGHHLSQAINCYSDTNQHHEESGEASEANVIYQQQQHHYQLLGHNQPVNGAEDLVANGLYQAHTHTQANYQTVYYEPINFDQTCTVEHQPNRTFVNNNNNNQLIIDGSTFNETQQQINQDYFQYNQHIDEGQLATSPILLHQQTITYSDSSTSELNQTVHQTLNRTDQTGVGLVKDEQLEKQSYAHQDSRQQEYVQYQQLDVQKQNYHPCYLSNESTGVSVTNSQDSSQSLEHEEEEEEEEEEEDDDEEDGESSEQSSNPNSPFSENSSDMSSSLTKDEKRAREANIPLTYHEIVNLSIDQFNDQLAIHKFTSAQLTLIKDIRRRGKNKVAAQTCRKKKMEEISELQHEVNQLANKRRALACECAQLLKDYDNLNQEYDKLCSIIQDRLQQQQQQ